MVKRRQRGCIEIEHLNSTEMMLVGLQVWRGAFVLADFLFHHRHLFANQHILELGSGVGLSSIAAAIYTKKSIICTDIDIGGILALIQDNVKRNMTITGNENRVKVMELDFKNLNWCAELQNCVGQCDTIIAADGELFNLKSILV